MTNANLTEIREEGFRVLIKGLGAVGTINFLRQFEGGSGDYTKEREELLGDITVDEIAARVSKRKEHRDGCS